MSDTATRHANENIVTMGRILFFQISTTEEINCERLKSAKKVDKPIAIGGTIKFLYAFSRIFLETSAGSTAVACPPSATARQFGVIY